MRNWNEPANKNHFHSIPVFILPMRNWNCSCVVCPLGFAICFHLTYEELKPFRSEFHKSIRTVFILPMRNWNSAIQGNGSGHYACFHLTWGIETTLGHAERIPRRVSSYLWELKQLRWKIKTTSMNLFHLTYEELKHDPVTIQNVRFDVFILPMRNWNIFTKSKRSRRKRFHLTYEDWNSCRCVHYDRGTYVSSYLWELKLDSLIDIKKLQDEFSSYLWGIETFLQNVSIFRPNHCFHLTYEELKPLGKAHNSPDKVFSSYLWGIETPHFQRDFWRCARRFHLTYEELKQRLEQRIDRFNSSFHLTYEELKPGWLFHQLFSAALFSSYLWGIETHIFNSK